MYYEFSGSRDRSVIGEDYPQMEYSSDDELCKAQEEVFRYIKRHAYRPIDIAEVDVPFTIDKNAKLTDLISTGLIGFANQIVKDNLLNIIERFNCLETKVLEIKLLHKKIIYTNYKVLHFAESLLPHIDYNRTDFYSSISQEDLSIKDFKDFMTQRNEMVKIMEQPFARTIYIQNKFVEGLDYFTFGFAKGKTIVSQTLKNAIETEGITGVEFKEVKDLILI